MQMSEQINELAAALSKVQSAMKPAKKDSTNPFFKSKYADLSSVWEACKDELTKNGLAVCQTMESTERGEGVRTTLMHSSGQWISGVLVLNPAKNDPQGIGSALTYARRYGLAAILGIVTEDDDGNAASRPEVKKAVSKAMPISKAGQDKRDVIRKMLVELEEELTEANIKKLTELEPIEKNFDLIIERLEILKETRSEH